jgi:signal transduction histidine kinase
MNHPGQLDVATVSVVSSHGMDSQASSQGEPEASHRAHPGHPFASILVASATAGLVLMLFAHCFVSAQRELSVFDDAHEGALAFSAAEISAQRVELVRQVTMQQSGFALLGSLLVLAMHLSIRYRATLARRLHPLRHAVHSEVQLADMEELHTANRLATVGRLTAGMAHEFGTPLGVVLARAQMIRSDESTIEDMHSDADAIIQQVKRMTTMCREVLDYARPKAPLELPTDVVQVVRHMATLLLPDARKRNVLLSVAPDPPVTFVLGDASKLMQVLTNLIINALQAMPQGGPLVLRVEHRFVMQPQSSHEPCSYACIRVEDNGTGIHAKDLPHVFDTFFTTKREGEGTGLGLSVSARVVKEHGGWIDVTTEQGKGTCFSVYLPLSDVQKVPACIGA